MYVEVERGVDTGMTQQGAYGFVVALALDAAGGKSMTPLVEYTRQSKEKRIGENKT